MPRFDEWFEPSEVLESIRASGKKGIDKGFLRKQIKTKFHGEFDAFLKNAIRDNEVVMVNGRLVLPGYAGMRKQIDNQLHDTYSGFG